MSEQRKLNEEMSHLPAYEVRRRQEEINATSKSRKNTKFAFSTKSRPSVAFLPKCEITSGDKVVDDEDGENYRLSDRIDVELDLRRQEPYSTISFRGLKRSTIDAHISRTTIFIDGCEDSTFIGEAQQWRVHNCARTRIRYICTNGDPIIENCKEMEFFNVNGETKVIDFSDLSGESKNWRIIES